MSKRSALTIAGFLVVVAALVFLFLYPEREHGWFWVDAYGFPTFMTFLSALAFDVALIGLWEVSSYLSRKDVHALPFLFAGLFLPFLLLMLAGGQDLYLLFREHTFLSVTLAQIYYTAYFLLLMGALVVLVQIFLTMRHGSVPSSALFRAGAALFVIILLFAVGGGGQTNYGMAAPIALWWGALRTQASERKAGLLGFSVSAISMAMAMVLLPILVGALVRFLRPDGP